MTMRMQIAVTVLFAAIVAGGWFALSGWEGDAGQQERGKRAKATIVMVETLTKAKDQLSLRVVGTGEALRSASIHPTVSGEVIEILFTADQRVKRGAPLVHLDDKHEKLAVRLAEVALQEAERQADRLKKLAPTGSVPMARLETALTELESATVRLEQAQANLADRTVRAPFDGVIGLTKLDVGDRVTDETMVATLDDRSVILVEFVVPEEYAGKIALGDAIEVRPWMDQDRVLEGKIAAIDSRIDQATRSLTVQAQIPNADESIRPGTAFDVRLAFVGRLYPLVEEVAVSWSGDGAYLWRVTDGRLKVGDLIVVEGVQGLRDGQLLDARPARGSGGAVGDAISKAVEQESGKGG